MPDTLYIFFGVFPMFLRERIFWAPFLFTFSLFSLSLVFIYRWIFYMLVQVKQIGWVLTEFLLQK